jgi:hypothetical protein
MSKRGMGGCCGVFHGGFLAWGGCRFRAPGCTPGISVVLPLLDGHSQIILTCGCILRVCDGERIGIPRKSAGQDQGWSVCAGEKS